MYAWGPDTSTWAKPGAYKYDSARAQHLQGLAASAAAKGPRKFATRQDADLRLVGTLDKILKSDSENPLVVAIDVTGSMSSWPAEIFDRLPLMYQTLSQYKPDLEIAFGAIGDANTDRFPIQMNNFGKGVALEEHLKAIGAEGGGGGQGMESYELMAYFLDKKVQLSKAVSPFLIIYGDEGFYDSINPDQVKHYIGDTVKEPLSAASVFASLTRKFDTYLLHKEYDGGASRDRDIVTQWRGVLGREKVIPLYEAERAVDVAMGLIAKKWGHFDDFKTNLAARQDPAAAKSVYTSLVHIPTASQTAAATKSTIVRPTQRTGKAGKTTHTGGTDPNVSTPLL